MLHDQITRELQYQLAWRKVPWITDKDPPQPGRYLVSLSIDVHDDGNLSRFVNMARWDGTWNVGGYVTVEGWYWEPEPCSASTTR